MLSGGLLDVDDLGPGEALALLDAADEARRAPWAWQRRLEGRQVALLFEKPSTRTRVAFEVAVASMGGHPLALGDGLQLCRGESLEDTARVLSRYVDALVVRTHAQERLERLAEAASVPVVNALSDEAHPTQALADLQTVRQLEGRLAGVVLAYVGDGNNVAASLALGGALTGVEVRVATPPGRELRPSVVARAAALAQAGGGALHAGHDPIAAVAGADALYTDVWRSMHDPEPADRGLFAPYRVDAALLERCGGRPHVLHCLPAHRGEEIAAEVLDGPRSQVLRQAENKLHTAKALLVALLAPAQPADQLMLELAAAAG